MSEAMTRENFSLKERDPLERSREIVRKIVWWHRSRGAKCHESFHAAALDLETSSWAVKALKYNDGIWSLAKSESDRLLRRWGWHLDRCQAELAQEVELIRIQRDQLSLRLGDGECQHGGGTCLPPSPNGRHDVP